jgi:hypothetical protein
MMFLKKINMKITLFVFLGSVKNHQGVCGLSKNNLKTLDT